MVGRSGARGVEGGSKRRPPQPLPVETQSQQGSVGEGRHRLARLRRRIPKSFSDIRICVCAALPLRYGGGAMLVLRTAQELEAWEGCALVPTMGALHEGHASLIRAAAATGLRTVATIFVNPTQFAPHEDFSAYPRTEAHDLELARAAGAAAVFAPSAAVIYPDGAEAARARAAAWPLPPCATEPGLEDTCRPGHFGGVCQVVARLFDLTRPALAIFGEKDYQQLRVLTQMVERAAGRWGGLRVQPGPTVREPDGLAMSSRNRYMRPEQRAQALGLEQGAPSGPRRPARARSRSPHARRADLARPPDGLRRGARRQHPAPAAPCPARWQRPDCSPSGHRAAD